MFGEDTEGDIITLVFFFTGGVQILKVERMAYQAIIWPLNKLSQGAEKIMKEGEVTCYSTSVVEVVNWKGYYLIKCKSVWWHEVTAAMSYQQTSNGGME